MNIMNGAKYMADIYIAEAGLAKWLLTTSQTSLQLARSAEWGVTSLGSAVPKVYTSVPLMDG